jgi:hypothetical protein
MDLIKWIRSKGGINRKCPSIDARGLSLKECRYIGLISKNGRYLDELRDEAEWEGIICLGTSTDDFNEIILNRINGNHTNITETEIEKQFDKEMRKQANEVKQKINILQSWLDKIKKIKSCKHT